MRENSNIKLMLGSICIGTYAVFVLVSGWGLLNLDNKGTLEPAINSTEEIIALSVIILIFILLALSATLLVKGGKKLKITAILFSILALIVSTSYIVIPASSEALPYVLFLQSPLLVGIVLSIYGYRAYIAAGTHKNV